MPIYEYQCQQCGNHLEIMQKISDAPLAECSACGGALEKQWSQTSFQLKGSGWYVSDYGKGGNVPKVDGDKKPASEKSDATAGETPQTDTTKAEPAKTETPAPAATPKTD